MPSTMVHLLIGGLTLALSVGDPNHAPAAAVEAPAQAAATRVRDVAGKVQRSGRASSVSAQPAAPGLAEPVRSMVPQGMVYLPRGFRAGPDGTFDVVLHFHGVPNQVEGALDRVGLKVALLTVNLGIGSGPYENAYAGEGAVERALDAIKGVAHKKGGVASPRVGRVALSAWSAGYGAVSRILSNERAASLVDAVLLADGLHAGFTDKHQVDPHKMAPFVRFAQAATVGDKLMGLTHSSIGTDGYASTTQTAGYLLGEVDLDKQSGAGAQIRISNELAMTQTYAAQRGQLTVRGFEGGDKAAHCNHLFGLGVTLFPLLAERWSNDRT